jgi:hypothetical protein
LLLYSSKPSLGVFQLAGYFTSSTRPHHKCSTSVLGHTYGLLTTYVPLFQRRAEVKDPPELHQLHHLLLLLSMAWCRYILARLRLNLTEQWSNKRKGRKRASIEGVQVYEGEEAHRHLLYSIFFNPLEAGIELARCPIRVIQPREVFFPSHQNRGIRLLQMGVFLPILSRPILLTKSGKISPHLTSG